MKYTYLVGTMAAVMLIVALPFRNPLLFVFGGILLAVSFYRLKQ